MSLKENLSVDVSGYDEWKRSNAAEKNAHLELTKITLMGRDDSVFVAKILLSLIDPKRYRIGLRDLFSLPGDTRAYLADYFPEYLREREPCPDWEKFMLEESMDLEYSKDPFFSNNYFSENPMYFLMEILAGKSFKEINLAYCED